MMDVSLYVRDAPHRLLPLLGGDKSGHDWYNLLSQWDALDAAEGIADALYSAGVLICVTALAIGVTWAVRVFLRSGRMATEPFGVPSGSTTVDDQAFRPAPDTKDHDRLPE